MAFSAHAKPAKRKPATYGRPSAHRTFGFDSADELESSQDDIRPSKKLQGGEFLNSQPREPRSPANRSYPSSAPDSQGQTGSEPDLYDVPSDGDDVLASPFQHTAKKRRMPPQSNRKKILARESTNHQLGDTPRSNKTESPATPQQKHFTIRRKDADESPRTFAAKKDRSGDTTKDVAASKSAKYSSIPKAKPSLSPAWEPESNKNSNLPAIVDSFPSSPSRMHHLLTVSNDRNKRLETPESAGPSQSSPSQPVTPPSTAMIDNGKTPCSVESTPLPRTPTFMSPSNLEIPKLAITSAIKIQRSPLTTPSASDRVSAPTPPERSKLKDRLTARNTSSRSVTQADNMDESDDSCIDSTDTEMELVSPNSRLTVSGSVDASTPGISSAEGSRVVITPGSHQTYSAKSRTLRRDEGENDDMLTSLAMNDEDIGLVNASRRIRTDAKSTLSQADNDDMDVPDEEEGPMNKLRNIHELREAGTNARLKGETEAIMEEIDSSDSSTSRWGLLNLVLKIEDVQFRTSILTLGFENRIFGLMATNLDFLSQILWAMAALPLLTQQLPQHVLDQQMTGIIKSLETTLKDNRSLGAITRDRRTNLTKSFQQEFSKLCKKYAKLSVWSYGGPNTMTPQLLALQLLEKLARRLRESRFRGSWLNPRLIAVLEALSTEYQPCLTSNNSDTDHEIGIKMLLSTIESSSMVTTRSGGHETLLWTHGLLEKLANILGSVSKWRLVHQGETLSLTLRLCLNLTNGDSAACDSFATKHVVVAVTGVVQQGFKDLDSDSEDEIKTLKVDNLVLALGFLINLAERSHTARDYFLEPTASDSIPLHHLLAIFTSRWLQAFEVTSEQESLTNVPLGYLAVLLTFLCSQQNIRSIVSSRLEGGTLHHLLVAADAFLSYNKKVTHEVEGGDEGADRKAHFLNRLEMIIEDLKAGTAEPK